MGYRDLGLPPVIMELADISLGVTPTQGDASVQVVKTDLELFIYISTAFSMPTPRQTNVRREDAMVRKAIFQGQLFKVGEVLDPRSRTYKAVAVAGLFVGVIKAVLPSIISERNLIPEEQLDVVQP
jgi:hypothetical protein